MMGTLSHGEVVPIHNYLNYYEKFLSYTEASPGTIGVPCPFSMWLLEKGESLPSLQPCFKKFCSEALPWIFSFSGRKDLTPSAFPHRADSPALWSSNVSLQNYTHCASETQPILNCLACCCCITRIIDTFFVWSWTPILSIVLLVTVFQTQLLVDEIV